MLGANHRVGLPPICALLDAAKDHKDVMRYLTAEQRLLNWIRENGGLLPLSPAEGGGPTE